MESITIKVAEKTAKEWEKASPKLRSHLEKSFEEQIERLVYQSRSAKFDILLNKIRDEAEANGLTEEILQEILNEDA